MLWSIPRQRFKTGAQFGRSLVFGQILVRQTPLGGRMGKPRFAGWALRFA